MTTHMMATAIRSTVMTISISQILDENARKAAGRKPKKGRQDVQKSKPGTSKGHTSKLEILVGILFILRMF